MIGIKRMNIKSDDIDLQEIATLGFTLIRNSLKRGDTETALDVAEALHTIPDLDNDFQVELFNRNLIELMQTHEDNPMFREFTNHYNGGIPYSIGKGHTAIYGPTKHGMSSLSTFRNEKDKRNK